MTRVGYPDLEVVSPNGAYRLDARSAANADGAGAFFQSGFRYRLTDLRSDRVLWQRDQAKREDSPRELLVSDEGWAILRTHGFSPDIIAVSQEGRDTIRVRVRGPTASEERRRLVWETPALPWNTPDATWRRERRFSWETAALAPSTAGAMWREGSLPLFLAADGRALFTWRARTGERLVLDLSAGRIVAAESVAEALGTAEREAVRARLRAPVGGLPDAGAAVFLASHHNLRDCAEDVARWEAADLPSYGTSSHALPGRDVQPQCLRALAAMTLRRLGRTPAGWAACHFTRGWAGERLAVPERIGNRDARLLSLPADASPIEVLEAAGAPDHVSSRSFRDGRIYSWAATWAYDVRDGDAWWTRELEWENRGGVVRAIDRRDGPASWDERAVDLLRWT
jgi:hypothetical protein